MHCHAGDVGFVPLESGTDNSIGAINQNFREVDNNFRRSDLTNGGDINGDLRVNGNVILTNSGSRIRFDDATEQQTAAVASVATPVLIASNTISQATRTEATLNVCRASMTYTITSAMTSAFTMLRYKSKTSSSSAGAPNAYAGFLHGQEYLTGYDRNEGQWSQFMGTASGLQWIDIDHDVPIYAAGTYTDCFMTATGANSLTVPGADLAGAASTGIIALYGVP